MYPEDIILEPLLTEKSNSVQKARVYVFKVLLRANKIQIKAALKKLYDVQVIACNVVVVKGKKKKQGRFEGKTSKWKKAIVTLKEGDAISIFEGA